MAPHNIEDIYPLTPLQEGLLFHTLRAPGSGVYVVQVVLTFLGVPDVVHLHAAWRRVVGRHPVLRSLVTWEGRDRPLQVVRARVTLPLAQHDWRDLTDEEQAVRLDTWLGADRSQGFVLERAPLLRLALLRLGEASYRLAVTFHHLILDGWSLARLLEEVRVTHAALCAGRAADLPPVVPFRQYVTWLQSQDMVAAERFWRTRLHGLSAGTELRLERVVTVGPCHMGYATLVCRLSAEASRGLERYARKHRLTLNTLVQGAWALLLGCYSGQDTVMFGVAVAGRPPGLVGMDRVVGPCINTLPLHVTIPWESYVSAWLPQLQSELLTIREYEYYPLAAIRGWCALMFDSLVVFENYPMSPGSAETWGAAQLTEIVGFEQTNYPITAIANPGDELTLRLGYDRGRYDTDAMERLLGHWVRLLIALAVDEEHRLEDVQLLSDAEYHEVIGVANAATETMPGADCCVHQLFDAQAAATPEAVAVLDEAGSVTYAALDALANQIAQRLCQLGIGPDQIAGVCMRRSAGMVAALLGVLKAGGAYLPLDPSYPPRRLAYMLADACARAIVTEREIEGCVEAWQGPRVYLNELCGRPQKGAAVQVASTMPSKAVPANLAYIIYTSGSTGQPKGVAIEHRSAVAFLRWAHNLFSADLLCGMLASTSVCFDLSVFEVLAPLCWGGRVLISENLLDIWRLPYVDEIRVVDTVPSVMAELLVGSGLPRTVHTVCLAGEALGRGLVERLYAGGVAHVYNLYGPTEGTTFSTYAHVERGAHGAVLIGRPVSGTQCYILDGCQRPVPPGAIGELYIGGAGLARGYLKRPQLTAERFLAHPLAGPGHRLYATGDLARYCTNGDIAYVGRADQQIKIHGYRIELGEIETVLGEHPAVRECAIAVDPGEQASDPRLVAYTVWRDAAGEESDLRSYLQARLPRYMLPSTYVFLSVLPRTQTGKVDRRALPALGPSQQKCGEAPHAPRDAMEQIIARAWAAVLHKERVGIYDNFFDLGGNSLLMMRVLAQLSRVFGRDIPVIEMFRHSTVSALADFLNSKPKASSQGEGDAAEQRAARRRYGLGLLRQALPRHSDDMMDT
jgi:amino acid adenylation domain-containing protein